MKTKRLIYAGLAAMLFSSSLINVPAQVSAAESSSSSVTTNNKVTSESDTQAESDSAKSESSQSEHSQSIMLSKSSSTANNKKN